MHRKFYKMRQQLIDKITEFVNNGWELVADDTHRWVSCDGFYEVEFTLRKDGEKIYLHTESGGQDLENEWSENNPQQVYVDDMIFYLDDGFDVEYALSMINDYGA